MQTPSTSRDQRREIARGLVLLMALLPLFYFPDLISLYRLPKEALLAFLTAVLSWLWLLNAARQGDTNGPKLPLLLPILIYLLLSGLSLIGSLNIYEGIRHLLNLVLGIILFWITVNCVNRESTSILFRWISIGGAVVSFVGIIQAWGVDIPTLTQVAPPSSTFGNKNMAAQYLLFVLPITFYFVLSSTASFREWLYSAAAALIGTYLVYTGTRAAWGATALAFLILWLFLRAQGFTPQDLVSFNRRKWGFLLGIVVFVAAMKVVPPYFIPNFGAPPTLTRLQSMLEMETDTSAKVRFAIWANSLAMFKNRPLLGVGKGNFQFNYPLYNRRIIKDPSFSVEAKAGEAHNDYVQLLAEAGLLGTAAFVWILLLLARRFWQGLKEKVDPPILAIGFALTAILLEAFWDFPFALPVPTALFWIYASLLWSLTQDNSPQPPRPVPQGLALGFITFFALCATAASILASMHLRAEFYYSRAIFGDYEAQNIREKMDLAEKDFNQAVRIYPYDYRYHHWRAVLLLRKGKPEDALQANLRALLLNPYHINTINNLGVIYSALGNAPKAIKAFETALKIWPEYVGARNNLGEIYERLGNKEKAVEEFARSLRIDPQNEKAKKKLNLLLNKEKGSLL